MKMTDRMIDNLCKILYKTGGSVKTTCQAVGVSRTIFYRWVKISKKLATAFEESRFLCVLDVEDALFEAAKKGNVTACIFILTNLNPEKYKHVTKIQPNKLENELNGMTNNELLEGIMKMASELGVEVPKFQDDAQDIEYEDLDKNLPIGNA